MFDKMLETVESCNLNLLIGSGLSSPYLRTLGSIESLLTDLDQSEILEVKKRIIRCSLYKSYFDGVMSKNCKLLENDPTAKPVLDGYFDFIKSIGTILLKRKSTILGKEANLFTTNIDICLEQALERIGLECNDGFSGRFAPWFSLSNFNKAHYKRSRQYDNMSELPTVNLLKLHGSLTWRTVDVDGEKRIFFSPNLNNVRTVQAINVTPALLLEVNDNSTIDSLLASCGESRPDPTVDEFLEAFDTLPVVNPTKTKFRQTILNQTHYELLRIYSNELEKENTLLLSAGFSFADEHIREITLRAANSNPTLMIAVIAYSSTAAREIRSRFPAQNIRNDNVFVLPPEVDKDGNDKFKYDLPTINKKILGSIIDRIRTKDN